MGVLHAVYGEKKSRSLGSSGRHSFFFRLGLGAFTSPLVATQFIQLRHWSF